MRRFLIIAALCLCAAPASAQDPTPTQTPAQPAAQDAKAAKEAERKAREDAKAAQSQPIGEKVGMAGVEQAVNGRVMEFLAALRKGDEAALAPFYADDYSVTTAGGEVQTKAQRLEWAKANAARLGGLEYNDLKVRVYDDTAVVTGRATSSTDQINSRFIQVWVRQGGAWRLVAGQITDIASAPPAQQKP